MIQGTVVSVDETAQTCDVDPANNDARILGAKLKSLVDEKEVGILVFPKVGSTVLVAFSNGSDTDAFVVSYGAFEQVKIWGQNGFKMVLDLDGNLTFNDGQNDGLVKLPALAAEIAKVSAFMTAVKNIFSNWTPISGDGGAALKVYANIALAGVQNPDLSQVGNDKIKH